MRGYGVVCLIALSQCAGCADARGRFQEFEQRRAQLDDSANGGAAGAAGVDCQPPPPGVVHGRALMALETTAKPGVAILFFGQLETPELSGQTAVEYRYRALDASDRATLVGGELVVGPYAIAEDGAFEAPTAKSMLPGSANAILPGVPITSELTLHGSICGVSDFYCGTVTGMSYSPVQGPTSGQFGLTLLGDATELPARPRFGCAEAALAPELP